MRDEEIKIQERGVGEGCGGGRAEGIREPDTIELSEFGSTTELTTEVGRIVTLGRKEWIL